MTRKEQYSRYLKGDKWKELRSAAMKRTNGMCQYCNDIAVNVHHVKYPKNFGDEPLDDLIPVCKRCHNICHGVQEMNQNLVTYRMDQVDTVHGGKMSVVISEEKDRIYASLEEWSRSLRLCKELQKKIYRLVPMYVKTNNENHEAIAHGVQCYSWHVISQALKWSEGYYTHNPEGKKEAANNIDPKFKHIKKFLANYNDLYDWGSTLQTRALIKKAPQNNDTNQMIAQCLGALTKSSQEQDGYIKQHSVRIESVEDRVTQIESESRMVIDKSVNITSKEYCIRNGISPTSMPLFPRNKSNYDALLSHKMKYLGIKPHKKNSVQERLPGREQVINLNTWRYKDIERADRNLQDDIARFEENDRDLFD